MLGSISFKNSSHLMVRIRRSGVRSSDTKTRWALLANSFKQHLETVSTCEFYVGQCSLVVALYKMERCNYLYR